MIARFEGLLFVTSITGPGDPRWKGGPTPERVARIKDLTCTIDGRIYYRPGYNEGWRKLLTDSDYTRLNRALDTHALAVAI